MKTDTVYKRTFNRVLEIVSATAAEIALPSESELSLRMAVSRTTVRKVLKELEDRRIVGPRGTAKIALRRPTAADPFPAEETVPRSTQVEKRFMEWMLRDNPEPGSVINALELARQFGVSTNGVREFLTRFARFGLIEQRPNGRWVFKGFTMDFAVELFDIREMFELKAARAFSRLPPQAAQWARLADLRDEQIRLLGDIEVRFRDFSALDDRFHRLIHEASHNRFVDDFYDIIAIVFHYHYQWNKVGAKQRNGVAIKEHLDYIAALFSRDPGQAEAACRVHLASARRTLLASLH